MKSNKGSALLVAILLSAILLAALAGLLTVALNEYRGSLKSYFNTAAFSLAESGVDRAAAAIVDKFSSATTLATGDAWPTAESVSTPTWYKKTSSGKTLYRGYFPAENLDKGRKGVCSVLCIEKSTTSYEVYTHGTVRGGEAGKGIEAQRAIKVEFTAKNGTGTPAYGCVSLGEFISSSTGDSNISKSQIGPTFDSYISTDNKAPNSQTNRYRNTTVGTTSIEHNKLNMGNGDFYCNVAIGKGAAEGTKIGYGKDADSKSLTPILAKIADTDLKKTETKYPADEKAIQDFVTRDLTTTITQPIPDAVTPDWTQILPSSGTNGGQWKSQGDVTQIKADDSSIVSYSNNTLSIGGSPTGKYYLLVKKLDGTKTINVTGEVILVVQSNDVASSGMNVNFVTPESKLSLYVANGLGVITSTQSSPDGTFKKGYENYEAKKLKISLMPTNNDIDVATMNSTQANAAVKSSIERGNTQSGTVNMNFQGADFFTGSINAPYSPVSLSADGNNRANKMSDYCGALMAKSLSIKGSNGFAFHFDQQLADDDTTKTKLSVSTWKQILPSSFAAQL